MRNDNFPYTLNYDFLLLHLNNSEENVIEMNKSKMWYIHVHGNYGVEGVRKEGIKYRSPFLKYWNEWKLV